MIRDWVNNKTPEAKLLPKTSGGVTNAPVPRLLTNAKRRSNQQGAASVTERPLDQTSPAKTKGTAVIDGDTKDKATDEASDPSVKA